MPCLHTVLYMQVRPSEIPFELIYLQCQRINSNMNILSGEAMDIVRWGGSPIYAGHHSLYGLIGTW
jgi:hypothetical protein